MNKVILMGRLTKDPEVRYAPVSYTHLDVYKRQDLYSTNVMAQFRPALIRLKGMMAGSSMGITSSIDVPRKMGVSRCV